MSYHFLSTGNILWHNWYSQFLKTQDLSYIKGKWLMKMSEKSTLNVEINNTFCIHSFIKYYEIILKIRM